MSAPIETIMPRACLGFRVAALSPAAQVREIQCAMDERRPLRALQLNVANLHAASRDPWLAAVFRRAELLTAEGRGLYFGSRVAGPRIEWPVTGIELMLELLADAEPRGDRCYFLGAEPSVLQAAVASVRAAYGDIVAGSHDGYYRTNAEQKQIAEDVRSSGANLVLVGISTPKKEAWIDRWTAELSVPHLGVGGSFDVLAGRVRLAPQWVRRAGLEWAFRLGQEPRRLWRRYLTTNAWLAWRLARARLEW